jgi:uncharacterized protein (DUF924 family)
MKALTMMINTTETPESIHRFWFGEDAQDLDDVQIAQRQSRLWWSKHADADAEIRKRFSPMIQAACAGTLDDWTTTPYGLLALILLTDQFPRNAWRGTRAAFSADDTARRFCRLGLKTGADRMLRPIERVFHYIPLEHSEALDDQEEAVALFQMLVDAAPPGHEKAFDGFLDFAKRHRDVIARFGRFPHRNGILDRASTPEETAFLAGPGSRF